MWTISLVVAVLAVIITPAATRWYTGRRVKQSMEIVQSKLREFETIADTYTKNGTPDELQDLMENLEEMMDELQFIDDNNVNNKNHQE